MKVPPIAHGVLAHYFTGPGYPPAQGALTVGAWDAGLDAYGDRLVGAQEWLARFRAGRLEDKVAVTLDDGLAEQVAIGLPVLERLGLTAFWDIYTGPYVGVPNRLERYRWLRNHAFGGVDGFYQRFGQVTGLATVAAPAHYLADRGYLTAADRQWRYWRNEVLAPAEYEAAMERLVEEAGRRATGTWIPADGLRRLHATGHVLGFHTHSHPTVIYADWPEERQALEYATARYVLATLLDVDPARITTMSHPRGQVTPYGLRWLREQGIELAWGARITDQPPLECPRWSTGYWSWGWS